ncbi:MAG: carboxypeptidase regulatory-like domain-containing protein [Candidatus Cloacimonetes bacterium]|nr:carboxypeptidase regulatory-like domain-containing protein [Candidatus Cloacimonadota bacterium]
MKKLLNYDSKSFLFVILMMSSIIIFLSAQESMYSSNHHDYVQNSRFERFEADSQGDIPSNMVMGSPEILIRDTNSDNPPPNNVQATVNSNYSVELTWQPPNLDLFSHIYSPNENNGHGNDDVLITLLDVNRELRSLLGFNIYRALVSDIEDPSLWATIATNIPSDPEITTYTYTDPTWANLSGGRFRYIVRAVYTDDVLSDPALSNMLLHLTENQVIIGNPESTTFTNANILQNINWRNSYTQTIYLEEELNMEGLITQIQYRFRAASTGNLITAPVRFQFYLAVIDSDIDEFSSNSDWLPAAMYTQVFDGFLPLNLPGGDHDIIVVLDEPFPYSSGNLVVASTRTFVTGTPVHPTTYQWQNNTNLGPNRTLSRNSDLLQLYVGEQEAVGNLNANVTTAIFTFVTEGFGHLQGTITSAGSPVPDVRVALNGTPRAFYTNAEGLFLIPNVFQGTHSITATKVGYLDYVSPDVYIPDEQTITHNFSINPSPAVTVSGVIFASDTLLPLAGAAVQIAGYTNLGTLTTNAQGEYFFPEVWIDRTYTIYVNAIGFEEYVQSFDVGDSNLILPNITIQEIQLPPTNVVFQRTGATIEISWDAPIPTRNDLAENRDLESYTLYRANEGEHLDPLNWLTVATGINTTSYNDETWANIETGLYHRYIVVAVYTHDIMSPSAMSPSILWLPAGHAYIGNPEAISFTNLNVLQNFNQRNSLTQNIYYESEIGIGGLITHVQYRYRASTVGNLILDPIQIQLYMAIVPTDKLIFNTTTDWIPADQFTMVFDGFIPVDNVIGEKDILIELDTPFVYLEGNLVIASTRTFISGQTQYAGGNSWQNTSPGNTNRTLSRNHLNQQLVLGDTAAGVRSANLPNTRLIFSTSGMGNLSGNVTTGNPPTPLEGVEISINDTTRKTFTDANGDYFIQFVFEGNIGITASLPGFIDYVNENILIEDGQTTYHDFSMLAGSAMQITGTVISSNTNLPVIGAAVSLTGYTEIGPVATNEYGVFVIPNVFAEQSYNVVLNNRGYKETIYPLFTDTEDMDLGNLMIFELTYPPRYVTRTLSNNVLTINWSPPDFPLPGQSWITHSNGLLQSPGLGMASGGFYESAHRFTSEQLIDLGVTGKSIAFIQFWPNNPTSIEERRVRVYVGGSGSPLNPGEMVVDQVVPSVVQGEWNIVELNTPVLIPPDVEIWYSFYSLTPAGVNQLHFNDTGQRFDNFGNIRRAPDLAWGGQTSQTGNWMMRAIAIDDEQSITFGHTQKFDDINVSKDHRGFNSSRIFEGTYNVYRAPRDDLNNPDFWIPLALDFSPDDPENPSITDLDWLNLPHYEPVVYIVQSIFTNNNLSVPINTNHIVPYPIGMTYVGNPESTLRVIDRPIPTMWETGVTQVIYYEEEINLTGIVSQIMLNHNRGNANTSPDAIYHFWLANTNKTSFTTNQDWVPYDDFVKVFEGPILDFAELPGINYVTIDLDPNNPFVHEGGNIVLMGHKSFLQPYFTGNNFLHTASPGLNRTLGMVSLSDNAAPPYITYPNGSLATNHANIAFIFDNSSRGHLSGVVTTGNPPVPLEGVEIVIDGSQRRTFTNADGQYSLSFVPEGNMSISAYKHRYQDAFESNINIVENQTTTRNFEMGLKPNVTVDGIIRASDTLAGLSGANITLTGYDDFNLETDENGLFTIPTVFSGYTYKLVITREGYVDHVDEDFFVETTDMDIDIIMIELPFPAINAHAEIIGNAAFITWDEPDGTGIPQDIWFTHTTGVFNQANSMGLNGGGWYETAHRFTAEHLANFGVNGALLTHLEFVPNAQVSEFRVRVYVGSNGDQPGSMVVDQIVPSVVIREWNLVVLDTPVQIPENDELWYSFRSVHLTGQYPHGNDDGPAVDGYGNLRAYEGLAFTPQASASANWMIRGLAEGAVGPQYFGHFANRSVSNELTIYPNQKNIVNINQIPSERNNNLLQRGNSFNNDSRNDIKDAVELLSNENNRASLENQIFTPRRVASHRVLLNNRALEGYNLYRAPLLTLNDEDTWIPIANNIPDTEYLDESWINVDTGAFRYAIKAVYTNDVVSIPTFTNMVSVNMSSKLHLELYAYDDASVEGARVRLVNNLGTQHNDQIYEQIATGTVVLFPDIWRGIYTLTVTLAPYLTYTNPAINIMSDLEYGVYLHDGSGEDDDLIFPVRYPEAILTNNDRDVLMTWQAPILGNPIGYRIQRNNQPISETIPEKTFTDTNVIPGLYTYSVIAVFETDNAPPVSASQITVPALPPRDLEATLVNQINVLLTWEAALANPTGYKVFRDDDLENPLVTGISGVGYTDTKPPSGDRTYFVVATYTPTLDSERVSVEIYVPPASDDDTTINILATELTGNFPNPFNPATTIQFDIKEEGLVRIDIFNIRGQRVHTLVNDYKTTGRYKIDWYGVDDNGREVASGVYFYRMQAEGFSDIKRMLLMK